MVIYKNEKDIIDYLGLTDNLDYFNNNKRSILKAVKIAERLKADYILECDFNNIYENHDLKQKLRINGIVIFEVYEKKEENYLKNISQELKKWGGSGKVKVLL